MTEDRLTALEQRLRELEDKQEIVDLLASYGPLVDSGSADEVAALWSEDGVYDVDEICMNGRDEIRAMVRSDRHQGWIKGGCAHFLGPARVHVRGDSAVGVCHSLMIVNRGGDFETDPEFVVRRATAHHFELERSAQGWVVTRRTSRVLDGRAEAPELLRSGALGSAAPN
ncbi:nuclear transport factor 2 family protein [Nocardioides alcanivorans]|uniref:nuclear transport factor 2 family protein n=1 Tax=Nocardioides alcanivorans TaxID=2897352 RepID=UPI001F25C942|nr:nuclear transport factor 2 family protein [Nocardioides alcanivorans]